MTGPEDAAPPGGTTSARWHDFLDELRVQVPDLAEQYVGRVRTVPGYESGSSVIDDQDLLATATTCISLLIEAIRQGSVDSELHDVAVELGRRRAFQRVPSESLVIAMQLDFGVIWSRLLELCGPRDAIILTAHVEPTWRTVEAFTAAVMSSYASERARLAQHEVNQRQATIGRLFAVARPPESLARAIAFEIGCDPSAPFTTAVIDQSDAQERVGAEMARIPRSGAVYAHRMSGATVVFWPTLPGDDDPLSLRAHGIRAARARGVHGLAAVPRSARTLLAVLEAVDPFRQEVIDLEHSIPALARRALVADEVDLAPLVDDRLTACTPAERERIVETLRVFFVTGSVGGTAERLRCHRNTVLNRLSRFTDLTGLDVTVPQDAVTAMLALDPSGPP